MMLYSNLVFLVFIFSAASVVLGKKGFGPGSQEYGYVEVRKGAHMFYWLYYKNTVPESEAVNAPLVIWLQGGPGTSSTGFGNFIEIGTLDTDLKKREFAWTKYVNVLFIDNPVGTGFSYVENDSLYTKNNHQIALDLMTFIKAFYKKYQKFESKTPLYIFSESYGGKMAIEFAYELYKDIMKYKLNINFKGVALGDSWISPIDSCLTWAPYLLNLGVVDTIGFHKIDEVAQHVKQLVDFKKWKEATDGWSRLEKTLKQVTYGVDFYNVLLEKNDIMIINNGSNNSSSLRLNLSKNFGKNEDSLKEIMGKVKTSLKVIPSFVSWSSQMQSVSQYLNSDFMKPVTNIVEKVLNETNLQVVVYNGQLDLIVDTPGTLKWVERLKWPDAEEWNSANRTPLMVDNRKEGFIKKYKKFAFYWINRAGHMIPEDNPEGAKEMLRQVTQFDKLGEAKDRQYYV